MISDLLESNGIKQQFCQQNDKKCLAIAERFNRTIKLIINKYFTANNTVVWYDKLQDFVNNYNNSIHSSTNKKPNEITAMEEKEIINDKIENNLAVRSKIKIGDTVRLPLSKSKFEKEGRSFTDDVFKVTKVMLANLQVEGKTKKFPINAVLKVPAETKNHETKKITAAKKESKVERAVKREGLELNFADDKPAPRRLMRHFEEASLSVQHSYCL
jgi:hypothetical protein